MPLLTLLARTGVLHWLAKSIARRIAARCPGSVLEDTEEAVDIIATEFKDTINPMSDGFWKRMYQFWKTDVQITHDVPRFAASMDEVES